MSARVIYVMGVPASGKSTVFRTIRTRLFAAPEHVSSGLYKGVRSGPFHMCGVFDGSTFEGTDKLSNTAIGDALKFYHELDAQPGRHVIFVEGDRLLCKRFISETRANVFLIDADAAVLRARRSARAKRGECQSEKFLKAKRTKIENMKAALGDRLRTFWNNEPGDASRIAYTLERLARKWIEG